MNKDLITALIIEDEKPGRDSLLHLLSLVPYSIEVLGAFETVDEAILSITKQQPDIIFLDIKLPKKNGFALFEHFKDDSLTSQIIITTAFNQYALKALQLSAIDYLLKPINLTDLKTAIDKAKNRLESKKNDELYQLFKKNLVDNQKKLAIPRANGFVFIQIDDILYCEADSNYTKFYTLTEGNHIAARTLKDYDAILEEFDFFRINRSYLINLSHLKALNKGRKTTETMVDDKILPVSELKKKTLLKKILGK